MSVYEYCKKKKKRLDYWKVSKHKEKPINEMKIKLTVKKQQNNKLAK